MPASYYLLSAMGHGRLVQNFALRTFVQSHWWQVAFMSAIANHYDFSSRTIQERCCSAHLFLFAVRLHHAASPPAPPAEDFRADWIAFKSSVPSWYTYAFTGLHRRRPISSMNCIKWRTSRLVSDSVLPHLHYWSSAALDYPPSGTEPFRLPLLASGTIYPSTSLLHLRCLSCGHASRLISSQFPIPVSDHVQCSRSNTFILDTSIVHATYLLALQE